MKIEMTSDRCKGAGKLVAALVFSASLVGAAAAQGNGAGPQGGPGGNQHEPDLELLEAQVDENTADIEQLQGAAVIGGLVDLAHTAGILKNKKDIDDLEEQVAENAEDIAENAEGVAENAEDIAENAEDIAENAEDIAENAEGIADNAAEIKINAEDIAQNADDILANAEEIAAVDARVDAVADRVLENTAGIAIALAIDTPDLVANEKFGVSLGWGTFGGSHAIGAAAQGVVADGIFTDSHGEEYGRLAVNAGVGVSVSSEADLGRDIGKRTGARAGFQITW